MSLPIEFANIASNQAAVLEYSGSPPLKAVDAWLESLETESLSRLADARLESVQHLQGNLRQLRALRQAITGSRESDGRA